LRCGERLNQRLHTSPPQRQPISHAAYTAAAAPRRLSLRSFSAHAHPNRDILPHHSNPFNFYRRFHSPADHQPFPNRNESGALEPVQPATPLAATLALVTTP